MKKKQVKIQLMLMPSPELENSIEELADVITENIKDDYRSEFEPFEQYVQKVRIHIHENVHGFRNRFVRGYERLLEEIANEQNER